MPRIVVLSPTHRLSPELAIAAARAGEAGILDLGRDGNWEARRDAVAGLRRFVTPQALWGVRWDLHATSERELKQLQRLVPGEPCPLVVLARAAGTGPALKKCCEQARSIGKRVLAEADSLPAALALQKAGFDGVILKGREATGCEDTDSSLILLQRVQGQLNVPYWIQGGIGPDTAAAACLAGAAGVVLGEALWLAQETPFDEDEQLEITEFGNGLTAATSVGSHAPLRLRDHACQVSQDIAWASRLASRHVNVAGILRAYRRQMHTGLTEAAAQQALAANAPFATSVGTLYPIVQGPMAEVTDVPAFAAAVADQGGLPLIALGGRGGEASQKLLSDAHQQLAGRPWGAGLSARLPNDLQAEQWRAVLAARPPLVLLEGAVSTRCAEAEATGLKVFARVGSAAELRSLYQAGLRNFVLEGSETGRPLGAATSFTLWQQTVDALSDLNGTKPDEVQLILSGGIHDALSAAMAAVAAARMVARGVRLGLMLRTGYLLTREAVAARAITKEFQRQMAQCERARSLAVGGGMALRAVETPFLKTFARWQQQSGSATPAEQECRLLEHLHLAAKGVDRAAKRGTHAARGEGRPADVAQQRRMGLFVAGEAAGLRSKVIPLADLHSEVSQLAVARLESAAEMSVPFDEPSHVTRRRGEEIAVVGMACMFPKADDLRQYWENIVRGVDAVEEVPDDRWEADAYFDADRQARDRVYSKWGGFLGRMKFDPMKWRIPPASLKSIEPLQLLSLEIAWRAMIDAGYDRRDFPRERAGVIFAAAGSHDLGANYCFRTMMRHYLPQVEEISEETRQQIYASLEARLPEWTEDSFPGFLLNVIAGRIAREFDLNGTNFVVDAACAASMAALQTAVDQLRSGHADMMLVGGADATNNPFCFMSFAKTHALSAQGRSRPFDNSADGIALGEGIGVMVLKRLRDAERDGDRIYAVIRGMGSSSDGKNRSLTAPHPPGQIRAVLRAYSDADIAPTSVALFEAHGTGTVVGDSAELTTLTEVVGSQTDQRQIAAVGSVKSMIGHTKTVAGLASLIKTVLALDHQTLPPTLGVETPSERFDFAHSPFYVNTETRPWIEEFDQQPRRAAVSSFGFGGTNFHVVLEEYRGSFSRGQHADLTPRAAEVFAWQRATRAELVAEVECFAQRLASVPGVRLGDLAHALHSDETQRVSHSAGATVSRLAMVAASVEDLQKKLLKAVKLASQTTASDPTGIFYNEAPSVAADQVCFLYPGQGSQAVNMLRDLLLAHRWGRAIFDRANQLLKDELPQPLSRYIFPPPCFTDAEREQRALELRNTLIAQPALGVVELFATELLERFGLRPGMTAGHSYGEHVALQVAGCFTPEQLMWLSAKRGQVCADAARTSPGGMAAVQADGATTEAALRELHLPVSLANLNAPDQTVIAGNEVAIEAAVEQLNERGLRAKRISVSAAFHSPLLHRSAEQMSVHFGKVKFAPPKIPVYSNTTGERHADDPQAIRKLLIRHFDEPVLFEQQVRRMYADGARVFIEVGPGKVLTDLVRRILPEEPVTTLAIDARGRNGVVQLAHCLAQASALGLPVEWGAWFEGRGLTRLGVEDFCAQVQAESTPRPTDWMLTASGAYPLRTEPPQTSTPVPAATPTPGATSGASPTSLPETGASPEIPAMMDAGPRPVPLAAVASTGSSAPLTVADTHREGVPPIAAPAAAPANVVTTPSNPIPLRPIQDASFIASSPSAPVGNHADMSTPHDSETPGRAPLALELFAHFQQTTRMFFELQRAQQVVADQYLRTQERLLSACLGQVVEAAQLPAILPPVSSLAVPAVETVSLPPAAPAPVRVAPATASHRPPVIIPATVGKPAPVVSAPVAPAKPQPLPPAVAPVAVTPAAPARAAHVENGAATPTAVPAPSALPASAAGPPSTEQFRQDLLQIVSDRTGYPVDMLDEELPLEAGLGIDSIKTVEIFSKLKDYHRFFADENEDEEERLKEFVKLKTLRDIIDSYDRRRQALTGSGGNGQAARGGALPAAHGTNGSANGHSKGNVERYAVAAAEVAPAEAAKKKSPKTTSSS